MGANEPVHIEFEMLGEAEVSRRVGARAFDEPTRANAMRWLNDRAMARTTGGERVTSHAVHAWEAHVRDARRTARTASTVSVLALALAVAALVLSIDTVRRAQSDVRRAETLAETVSSLQPLASTAPPRAHARAPAP